MIKLGLVPERSIFTIEGKSSIHPLRAATRALQGFLEVEVLPGNRPDWSVPPKGRLEIEVDSLKTGNELYDRETRRRLDIRRFPRITAELFQVQELEPLRRYRAVGDLSFFGTTRRVQGELVIHRLDDHSLEASGEYVFDIRDFGLDPPRILMLQVFPEFRTRLLIYAERMD